LSSATDCSQLFVVAALIAAVAVASPVSYSVVPVQRGVVAPAVTYPSSTYAYTSPIARYSDAVETYASAPVRAIVSPTVFATRNPVVAQASVDPQYDPNPQYTYSYSVNDADTGDSKSHEESRNGDSVQGSYSVVESDGSIRRVDYTADADNGFNAVVHRQVGAAPPPPVPVKSYAPAPAASAVARIASLTPTLAYKSAPSLSLKSVPEVTYQSIPEVAYKSAPAVALKTIPEVTYQSVPEVTYKSAPAVTLNTIPEAYQTVPAVTYKSAPAVALKTIPEVTYQSVPEVTYKSAPAVTLKTIPEAYQTVPAVRYAVPVTQQLVPAGSLTYSSVTPSVAKPSSVHTSFSAPFVNYEY
jgi:hypothetical protein